MATWNSTASAAWPANRRVPVSCGPCARPCSAPELLERRPDNVPVVADTLHVLHRFVTPRVAIAGAGVVALVGFQGQYYLHVFPGIRGLAQVSCQLPGLQQAGRLAGFLLRGPGQLAAQR